MAAKVFPVRSAPDELVVIVLGLMSGTSMDGIDVAAADLTLEGESLVLRPLGHLGVPYSESLRAELAAVLPPASSSAEAVCRLDTGVGQEFAAAAAEGLHRLCPGGEAQLVVSHGQTVFHWVEEGRVKGSLQLGQPAWIAEATGLPVVSDLRPRDIAAGGQGAPLVSLFDVLLLGRGEEPRGALNLGGIANLTVIPAEGDPFAFDAGPANALLDAAAARVSGGAAACDRDGRRARRGKVDEGLLAALLDDPYYALDPPKTTGKERFHGAYLDDALTGAGRRDIQPEDLLATLVAHAAAVVADACDRYRLGTVAASGGGTANPALMDALAGRLGPGRLQPVEEWGIPSQAKEAYAFAVLGFLTVSGLPATIPSCTGARRTTFLGRISPGEHPLVLPPPVPALPVRLEVERPP
jgi:anhydro-N-acetylmuramic acid kinase